MRRLLAIALLLVLPAAAQAVTPTILQVKYHIVENRSSVCSAVAVGERLILSCDHAVRADETSLGPLLAVNRKWDWALIESASPLASWSQIRDTPLQPGETLYFKGGTARVQPDGKIVVTSGQIIDGMSGGPIWDKDGQVVSVISEYEIGAKILFGYVGLAEWVSSIAETAPVPTSPVAAPVAEAEPQSLDVLRARIEALMRGETADEPAAARWEYYGASWCGPCVKIGRPGIEKLKADHPEVAGLIDVYDFDDVRSQAQRRGVKAVPCYVVVGPDGKVLARKSAAMTAAQAYEFYSRAVAKSEAKTAKAEPQSTGVRPFVRVMWQTPRGPAGGSGVVVGRKGDDWLVLTASHVTNSGSRESLTVEIDSQLRPARVLLDSGTRPGIVRGGPDVSLLAVQAGAETIEPVPIADAAPPVGTPATTHGFPFVRDYAEKQTRFVRDGNGRDTISGYFVSGESGGAVVVDGSVVGIFSTSNRSTYADICDVDCIRRFLIEAGATAANGATNTARQDNDLRSRIAAYKASGGVRYYVSRGGRLTKTPKSHLTQTHGWDASLLAGMTQDELDLLHGASHTGRIRPPKDHPPGDETAVHESACAPGTGYWRQEGDETVWVPAAEAIR